MGCETRVGSMIVPAHKIVVMVAEFGFVLAATAAVLVPSISGGEVGRVAAAETPDRKLWQAVAPGRVEPLSGEIKIAAPVMGRIGEVLVKVNDKVFAGEALMRLEDDEAVARLRAAEAQAALRKRARNDQRAANRAASRRQAEDAVADTEQAVVEARDALDRAAAVKRTQSGSEADIDTARTRL